MSPQSAFRGRTCLQRPRKQADKPPSEAIQPATSVKFATAAAINAWNCVLARPTYRLCRTPSPTSRPIRCSTTTRSR